METFTQTPEGMEASADSGGSQSIGLEPEVSMMDYAWNEDNIQIDFMTVEDLRKLIEKSGGKFESKIYSQSVTFVASMAQDALGSPTETPATFPSTSDSNAFTASPILTETIGGGVRNNDSVFPSSTPDPPLTLSLGAWQIAEEDLPIYVGSAAGVLILVILLLAVTTWRCCIAPVAISRRRNESYDKQNGSPRNNNTRDPRQSHESLVCLNGTRIESRIVIATECTPRHPAPPSKKAALIKAAKKDQQNQCDGGSVGFQTDPLSSPGKTDPRFTQSVRDNLQQISIDSGKAASPIDDSLPTLHDTSDRPSDSSSVDGPDLPLNESYVKIPPVDNFLASMTTATLTMTPNSVTTVGESTFHTFHPNGGGSSLGSGGSRRSSPSSDTITLEPMTSSISEVLPPRTVLTDGGDSYHRFRSLPNRNNRHHCNASSAKDAINGNIGNVRNNAQIPVTMSNGGGGHVRSPRHPMEGVADFLVGSRQADVEDLYAKVDYNSKTRNRSPYNNHYPLLEGGMVAIVSPLPVLKEMNTPTPTTPGSSSNGGDREIASGAMITFGSDCNRRKANLTLPPFEPLKMMTDIGEDFEPDDFRNITVDSGVVIDDPSLFYNTRTSL